MRPMSIILLVASLPALAGCVTDSVQTSSGRPLAPEPRSVAPAPQGSSINAVSLLKSQRPVDTNGNGFPNRLDVAVYLFARPYPIPRHAAGTLQFHYHRVGSVDPVSGSSSDPLATWSFSSEMLDSAEIDDIIGPGYSLALDLSAIQISSLPVDSVDLVVEFKPLDGGEIARGTSIQRIPFVIY